MLLDTVKGVASLAKQIGDIELNSKIIDLQSEVYDLIEENHQLRMNMKQLEEKMNELEDIKQIETKLKPIGQAYYYEKGTELDGPYCTGCWDKDNKLIRLHVTETYADFHLGNCPVCKVRTTYEGKMVK
jgi:regulator of replication initiation timing